MRLIVGMTGATGAPLGVALLQALRDMPEVETHLVMSKWAKTTIELETPYTAQDVAALSTNHFAPRIRVVKSGDISTAMACRQCEDAPCASVCPQGAIQRDNDVWWVDQRRCLGCKRCVVPCPYGAMTVTVMNQQAQALKCDLCHHRAEGPACVAACPTQALRVMVPAELEALCAQKRQRLALA